MTNDDDFTFPQVYSNDKILGRYGLGNERELKGLILNVLNSRVKDFRKIQKIRDILKGR